MYSSIALRAAILINRSALCLGILLTIFGSIVSARAADRGNANTSDGAFALYVLTTGFGNTGIGYDALRFTADANYNTSVGAYALHQNVSSWENTAVGYQALYNTTAGANTAVGFDCLIEDTTGHYNTAIGDSSLGYNTTGSDNTASGFLALLLNTTGSNNTAAGSRALYSNTNGSDNTAIGYHALIANGADAIENTAVGSGALSTNSNASFNTAIGFYALLKNNANNNTAVGTQALYNNTTGSLNTATGLNALLDNSTGSNNTADGVVALGSNTIGHDNIADGYQALKSNTTGNNNVALGSNAGANLTTGSNNIEIGANVLGGAGEANTIRIGRQGTQKSTFIAGISAAAVTGTQVVINTNGKLGVASSSARFKEAIKPMDTASEAILALKPVTFRYKEEVDPDGAPQFGLVAEEVEKVDRELVVHDEQGKPFTVRYEAVNAMLLNEFLKEHSQVQQLKAIVAQQQKQIETLAAGLQKVTARIDSNPSARRLASDN
jgi:trimeric autotransporter adhesin